MKKTSVRSVQRFVQRAKNTVRQLYAKFQYVEVPVALIATITICLFSILMLILSWMLGYHDGAQDMWRATGWCIDAIRVTP